MPQEPVTAVIVGAGHRAFSYASHALTHPDELQIVGVADPIERRREQAREKFGFAESNCFETAEELAARGRMADAVINGTMDHQHVLTSLPLLEAGYDMLLEKPFATGEDEMWQLIDCARRNGRKVMICHVLRYAPFYAEIRRRVAAGEIGEIISVQCTEHVSYHHVVVGYVRGKWNRTDQCHATMLMAKSCHDLDLIAWMKSGVKPVRVASYGSQFQFRPENAPPGAGTRCLVDCPVEPDCLYSARKHYLDHPRRWWFYVWDGIEHIDDPTLQQKEEYLRTTSPYGRCVYTCDHDQVDHQSVVINFEDGATATLNMIGGAARRSRHIHLIGTRGEIEGKLEDETFTIRHMETRPDHPEYTEETVNLGDLGDTTGARGGHGGGDERLTADFVSFIRNEPRSISCTDLDDSVSGHLIGFCADRARTEERGVDICWKQ